MSGFFEDMMKQYGGDFTKSIPLAPSGTMTTEELIRNMEHNIKVKERKEGADRL